MVQRKWLHGFLELCLLSMLAERRDYGRGLSERLVVAGFDEIPGGTLYPALMRLEKQGLVEAEREVSAAGPPRRYFRLTDRGTHVLAEQQLAWPRFRKSVDSTVFPRRAGKAAPEARWAPGRSAPDVLVSLATAPRAEGMRRHERRRRMGRCIDPVPHRLRSRRDRGGRVGQGRSG